MTHKLLVVDDEVEICEFLKMFFEEKEYDVHVAHNGFAAIEKAKEIKPDVVLLDLQMPEMDGLEALKSIKEVLREVKVIMVTAIETRDKIEQAMRLGADNYITKPLSLEYLENDVREKIEALTSH